MLKNLALTGLLLSSAALRAAPVDLALVLASDVSGSVDAADFALLQTGYVNAFNSAALVAAIQSGAIGSIAVTLVYWSDGAAVAVPWTEISDVASSAAFATAISLAPRPFSGGTGLTNALSFSSGLFATAPEATRQVIDVAGDGAEGNVCAFNAPLCVPLQTARDAFLGGGASRAINALWIDDRDFFGDDPTDQINALDYGKANVIGGAGAFQNIVQDFPGFEEAIRNKLVREVRPPSGIPEPSTYAMMFTGLGAFVLARLRRNRQR